MSGTVSKVFHWSVWGRLAVVLALGSILQAADYRQAGIEAFVAEDYKESIQAFEKALEARPDDADLLVWAGRAYGRRAERMSGLAKLGALSLAGKVRKSFERAVELEPDHVTALESLLSFYVEAPGMVGGGVDKAEPLAARIAKLSAARGRRAWAEIHRAREEWELAEKALREAVEIEPGEIGHRLSLASFLARRERFDESDRLFEKALADTPEAPQVWFAYGKELVRAERKPDQARRLLERYLKTPLYAPDAEPYSEARDLLKQL